MYEKTERDLTALEREHLERILATWKPPEEPQRAKANWKLRLQWFAGSAVGSVVVFWLRPYQPTAVVLLVWWVILVTVAVPRPPPPDEHQMSTYRRAAASYRGDLRRLGEYIKNGRASVERIEASRVALLETEYPIHLFDVGDDRMFGMFQDQRSDNDAPWPNDTFEIVRDPRKKGGRSYTVLILAYGGALEPRVVEHSELRFGKYLIDYPQPDEGLLDGSLDDPAKAYEPHAHVQ